MNPLHFITNLLPCFTMIVLEPIGFVHNACTTSQTPEVIKQEVSEIEILPEYAEGLQDIEQAEYIDLVFTFHHENGPSSPPEYGPVKPKASLPPVPPDVPTI